MKSLSLYKFRAPDLKYFVSLLIITVIILVLCQSYFEINQSTVQVRPAESLLYSGEVNTVNVLKGGWQEFMKKDYHLFVHKSFIDLRQGVFGETAVVITTGILRGRAFYEFNVNCKLYYEGEWITKRAALGQVPRSWRLEFTGWQSVHILCPISKVGPYPSQLILEDTKTLERVFLPVEIAESGSYNLIACVPIVYGNFNSEALIEWFELQRFFGVQKISMHVWKVSKENWEIFSYYKAQGLLDFYNLDTPYNITYTFEKNKSRAPAKPYFLEVLYSTDLTECMLRNYLRSTYIMVMDLDEVLVPKKVNNYHELLNKFKEYDTINFQMKNFDITCNFMIPDETHYFFKRPYKEIIAAGKESLLPAKSIHKALKCLMFLQHNCVRPSKPYKKQMISSDEVVLRHYRKRGRCVQSRRHFVEDRSLNRFSPNITERLTIVKAKLLHSGKKQIGYA
ncbi:unnamed protein product [Dimorphilus gyrociliatus]|uniref:Glycosyltransferase family 92 protein n=1 Tax=Dimorphilus gyrociliatus TaxID=2664684 RepID=A0A7I8W338_9ANNE|nr:unnamed protein product [Dimorphilus gyrociliatus]